MVVFQHWRKNLKKTLSLCFTSKQLQYIDGEFTDTDASCVGLTHVRVQFVTAAREQQTRVYSQTPFTQLVTADLQLIA